MPRGISPDADKAFLQGQIFTVEELKNRFSLAITINNAEIIDVLLEADRPLMAKEIAEKLKIKKADVINNRMKKLFKDKLVVRFYLGGHHYAYLLSEKGWENHKQAKKFVELEKTGDGRIILKKRGEARE